MYIYNYNRGDTQKMRSMTAFGRYKGALDGKDITVEIKSVNSRFLDCTVKISRVFSFLEERVKTYLRDRGISRGKVDVYIGVETIESVGAEISCDMGLAKGYLAALSELRDELGVRDDISVMSIARMPDVLTVKKPEEDEEKDWQTVKTALDGALEIFFAAREREGEKLRSDIAEKIEAIRKMIDEIDRRSKSDITSYQSKLEEKLRKVLADNKVTADESRILTECAIFADKVAIDEEVVRLGAHFDAFYDIAASKEPAGRRLDFLLQEMNREINTIGSKCNSAEIAHIVVNVKNEFEKIREQIQNLE